MIESRSAPNSYCPNNDAFQAAVQLGIEDADAGRTVPYEKVRRWMLSWSTEGETLSPSRHEVPGRAADADAAPPGVALEPPNSANR